MSKRKVVIIGAAGRDFHNFNTFFRDNPDYEVLAFTATQIPNIEGRMYPPELAGELYPNGIPIKPEEELEELISANSVDVAVFAYSDLPHEEVMHLASRVNAAGADYWLMGLKSTQIKSSKPLISICATRTGCGKSQTTRKVCNTLRSLGKKVAVIRHPMPYGDLVAQRVQKYETLEDMDRHKCTIEEREEYEPHIREGNILFAGVDYRDILRAAEEVADVVVWDGGNNDTPFYKADLNIVVADPHRAGHELTYHPGEANIRMADVIIINKMDSAKSDQIAILEENIKMANPDARVIPADSEIKVDDPSVIRGKKVVVVEDGPTLTHGEMRYGAGYIAAQRNGAGEIVDPRPFLQGDLKTTFEKYSHLENVVPAMGYGEGQIADLEATIKAVDAEGVVVGTPIDLSLVLNIDKPHTRVYYDLVERGDLTVDTVVRELFQ